MQRAIQPRSKWLAMSNQMYNQFLAEAACVRATAIKSIVVQREHVEKLLTLLERDLPGVFARDIAMRKANKNNLIRVTTSGLFLTVKNNEVLRVPRYNGENFKLNAPLQPTMLTTSPMLLIEIKDDNLTKERMGAIVKYLQSEVKRYNIFWMDNFVIVHYPVNCEDLASMDTELIDKDICTIKQTLQSVDYTPEFHAINLPREYDGVRSYKNFARMTSKLFVGVGADCIDHFNNQILNAKEMS